MVLLLWAWRCFPFPPLFLTSDVALVVFCFCSLLGCRVFFAPGFLGRCFACVASLRFLVLPAFRICGSSRSSANVGIFLLLLFCGAALGSAVPHFRLQMLGSPPPVAHSPFFPCRFRARPRFSPAGPQCVDVLDRFGSWMCVSS